MAENLKLVIAQNIANLRKLSNMTQLELAEKLNYSDKAVSKWESGASVPDVTTLYEIANIFGVTVDYLLNEDHRIPVKQMMRETYISRRRFLVAAMSVVLCWLLATVFFVVMNVTNNPLGFPLWLIFITAVPVSSVVALVFNAIWGVRKYTFVIISVLMWSLLTTIYLYLLPYNIWLIFCIGIPGQIIIALWAGMKKPKQPSENK